MKRNIHAILANTPIASIFPHLFVICILCFCGSALLNAAKAGNVLCRLLAGR